MNMKKITSYLTLLFALLSVSAFAQINRPPNLYGTTLLTVRYTGGSIYTGTTATTIATGTLTLTASKSSCVFPALSSCNIIYWPGSGTALLTTTASATAFAAGNVILGTATSDGTTLLVLTKFANPGWSNQISDYLSDGYFFVSPANCGSKATTTTTTDNGMVPVATGNVVHQFTTNTTGGSTQFTCTIPMPGGRTTAGKGILITDVSFLYGVQTTAISSIAAAAINTVTYPAIGGAAAGTVAAAGGTLVVLPASLQLTTTTTGQCFNENLAFPTMVQSADLKNLTFDQVFTNSAAATVYQICGLVVHYFQAPL